MLQWMSSTIDINGFVSANGDTGDFQMQKIIENCIPATADDYWNQICKRRAVVDAHELVLLKKKQIICENLSTNPMHMFSSYGCHFLCQFTHRSGIKVVKCKVSPPETAASSPTGRLR